MVEVQAVFFVEKHILNDHPSYGKIHYDQYVSTWRVDETTRFQDVQDKNGQVNIAMEHQMHRAQ